MLKDDYYLHVLIFVIKCIHFDMVLSRYRNKDAVTLSCNA